MFLRLTTVAAVGRALGALACVIASMSGHAAMGHHHIDMPRATFAFLLLLAASWRTHDIRWLLVAGQLSQVLVHGGLAVDALPMLAMHTLSGIATALLVWRVESVWSVCTALLDPLRRAVAILSSSLQQPDRVRPIRACGGGLELLHRFAASIPGRGPPVLA